MPSRPLKSCASPRCPGRATHGRYCESHQSMNKAKRKPDTRPSASRRGYDRKWRRIRAQYLKAHPDCIACGDPAKEVDHILPLAEGGTHQWSNLQPLCKRCHSQKTVLFDGGLGNTRGGGI